MSSLIASEFRVNAAATFTRASFALSRFPLKRPTIQVNILIPGCKYPRKQSSDLLSRAFISPEIPG